MIAMAGVLDAIGGAAFSFAEHLTFAEGLYWSVTTATTVGYGDITPKTGAGQVVSVLVMLTVIPLFGGAFSLIVSGLTALHVHAAKEEIKKHVEVRLEEHARRNGSSVPQDSEVGPSQ